MYLNKIIMKTILLSFTILLIQNVTAQQTLVTKSPPRKSTKIIVLIKDSANALLDRIAGVLYDKGYTIDNKDEKVKFISTKEREQKKWGMYYIVKARVNDTAVVFSGHIALNKGGHYFDVDYTGTKISSMREAWNELSEIARMFGDKIIFSK